MRVAYRLATVTTTPSIYLDAFNLMNIEAMAMERPVVASCYGGIPEIIVDGVTGRVCDPAHTPSYAEALIDLLTDTEQAAAMGKAGRRRVEEHFSNELQVKRYLELYDFTP